MYDADVYPECPVCKNEFADTAGLHEPSENGSFSDDPAAKIIDGRYEILHEIGRGGMSIVYLVRDQRLDKVFALKMIRCFSQDNANIVYHSLSSESALMRRLSSSYIPAIHDIVHHGNNVYIVMDYVDGATLQQTIERGGRMDEQQALHVATELCKALSYLHSQNPPIIFRDVKPANIMIQPDNSIKLIDFGIAKELNTDLQNDTTALGTRGYASPEHFCGLTDQRSDIYSFGMTIRYALTGKNHYDSYVPVQDGDGNDLLSPGFEYIIEKCTRIDPDQRYQSCKELLYDLDNIHKIKKSRLRKAKQQNKKRQQPSDVSPQMAYQPSVEPVRIDTSLLLENTVVLAPERTEPTNMIPTPPSGGFAQNEAADPDLELFDEIEGNYVFISYAHRDGPKARHIIQLLQQQGLKIWYDHGIQPGSEWRVELVNKIKKCGYFFSLVSANYFKSKHCSRELKYAADKVDNVLLIYLEKIQLPEDFEMMQSEIQAIFQYRFSDDEFLGRLFKAKGLDLSFFKEYNEIADKRGQTREEEEPEKEKKVFVAYDVNDYVRYARGFIQLLENAEVNVWHKLECCTDLNGYQSAAEVEFDGCDYFVFFLSEALLNDEAERILLAEALEKNVSKDAMIGFILNGNPQLYADYFAKMTIISSDSAKVVNGVAEMILSN